MTDKSKEMDLLPGNNYYIQTRYIGDLITNEIEVFISDIHAPKKKESNDRQRESYDIISESD